MNTLVSRLAKLKAAAGLERRAQAYFQGLHKPFKA